MTLTVTIKNRAYRHGNLTLCAVNGLKFEFIKRYDDANGVSVEVHLVDRDGFVVAQDAVTRLTKPEADQLIHIARENNHACRIVKANGTPHV